jgi:PAS domain S-box-containing protein
MAGSLPHSVLVVDDNGPKRYSTTRILRSAGFVVLEAATGREALERSAENPDLIVLDVNLPDMDGFEVCRRLRAEPRTARTPIVHLSATFVDDVDKVQGLESGADGYITQPVEPPVLIATVRAFLRARTAEEALRQSEAKFKAVFEQALNGIALVSEDLHYIDVNPAVCGTLGRAREDLLGRPIASFVPEGALPQIAEIRDALDAAGSWRGVMPVIRSDGGEVQLEWSVSVHSLPHTRLAITTDISRQKAVEADRERLLTSERAARADAERANRLKDDFLAALSHEIRTPLNAIVGWSHVLRGSLVGAGEPVTGGIEAIERNARVLTQLIADLLDVSRIAAGKLAMDLEWFDPNGAAEAAVAALMPPAQARGVLIELSLDPEVGDVFWDQARFQQVIWNLVDNAVKFSRPGGTVQVRVSGSEHETVLMVRDEGQGIAREFLPHVFERFRQEDPSTTRRYRGLGLGLTIVKQLVEAHDGTVAVDSEGAGHGATFTVRLPRQTVPGGSRPDAGRHHTRRLGGIRVLVVEDDYDARILVSRILREAAAEVRDLSDVSSALNELDTFHPDLIVSDIGMPREDGYDFIRAIRERGYGPASLPAIALTAFARAEDKDRALQAGYQVHLTKPVNTERLIEVAARLVHEARGDRNGQAARP